MSVRLYSALLLACVTAQSNANDANWNCQQDTKTKAWNCIGSAKDSAAISTPKIQEPVAEKPSQSEQPVEPVEQAKKPIPPASVPIPANKQESAGVAEEIPKNSADASAGQNPTERPKEQQATTPITDIPVKTLSASEKPAATSVPIKSLSASEKPAASVIKPAAVVAAESVPAYSGKPAGWKCDPKDKEGDWNCELTGSDPKGEARVIESAEHGFSLLDPAFDNKQENVFNTLRDRLQNNPWGNCTMQLGTQSYLLPDKKLRDSADTDLNANYIEIYDNEVGNYQGNVDLKRADQRASSNSANYDSVSQTVDLHGNVFYSENDLSMHTDSATLKLDNDQAKLRDTLFISPAMPIRGKADAVYRDSQTLSRYKGVAYTSCEPGNQDWVVHASDLKMNKSDGTGSAKNAWVEFKGVPVFYSPYLSFPIDNRRKSGFLAPAFGNTGRGGFNFTTPFYWNIAPNLDATLRPRYYTKRGILLAGDFRYLTEMTNGKVSLEYLPGDNLTKNDRYYATIKNNTRFTQNIAANLDLNLVSDNRYFNDLGNALSTTTFSQIRSSADISYIDQDFSLNGQLVSYQTIDPNLRQRLKPYRRLPQLNFNYDHVFEDAFEFPIHTAVNTEYVYFQHDDSEPGSATFDPLQPLSRGNIRALASGHRFNAQPSVSFPIKTGGAFVTPKLSLQYTQYMLDNQPVGYADSISRVLPIASVDSGLFLEKDINLFGGAYKHTIEPRLFYLYIPRVNQKEIPVFDTSLYDFWYPALFRENRFNGLDRTQDANQVTLALTSRLVDPKTGLDKLKLDLGQIFYFQDREVTAPIVRVGANFLESRVETSSFSPLVAELSSAFNEHLSIETGLQWDPQHNDITRGKAILHLVRNPGELFNVGYNYRKDYLIRDTLNRPEKEIASDIGFSDPASDSAISYVQNLQQNNTLLRSKDIIQTDMSFRWPLFDKWFAIGRWQYSLLYNQTADAFVGLEKETCCWRFRVIGRRFVNNIAAAANSPIGLDTPYNSQTGIYFQIELKGLTGLGEKLDDFFARSIFGYQRTEF